jgi:hypothetical protein
VLTAGPQGLTRVWGVLPRHERRSGRGAEGGHVVAVQDDAVVGQGVDIRRRDLGGAMETHIVPSLNRRQNTR